MDKFSDAKIVDSWHKNAVPWTVAVRSGQIESRKLITDRQVIETILSYSPKSVLDLGCGEGWLTRELSSRGIQTIGVDAIPDLIERAKTAGIADFRSLSYEQIAAGKLAISVDAIVCNFSLFGKESVEQLFKILPSLLNPDGAFIVQTLHPIMACGDLPYQDGWREGSWNGFHADFTDPAPWYFRTLENWTTLFIESGFNLIKIAEPIHPTTQQPASIVFIAKEMRSEGEKIYLKKN
jgi:2-polyprenyl-3-methyl-5-hydroxy-6-metoxy-1,4-benzoquinol methylase